MKKTTPYFKWLFILLTISITGCEDYFEYSPYAANVQGKYKGTFDKNINILETIDTVRKGEIKIAVISDPHYHYHQLNEAIVNINGREGIDFVVANGDITDHGYLKEYELFHENMNELSVPYFTVIGNHDYRSNGEKIYRSMFGNQNKAFAYNNSLFVLFDDVFWESNTTPDFDWLEATLDNASEYDHVIVFCHIPPYGIQFSNSEEQAYRDLMLKYNVSLSVHGHVHCFESGEYYNDRMQFLSIGTIIEKDYGLITINNEGVTVEEVNY